MHQLDAHAGHVALAGGVAVEHAGLAAGGHGGRTELALWAGQLAVGQLCQLPQGRPGMHRGCTADPMSALSRAW